MTDHPILDDPFHSCALWAYVEVWHESGCFPPDSEAVRTRACRYYEEELAKQGQSPN